MTRLTKEMVIMRAKESYLPCIKNLNCWGCSLTDVSIIKDMPEIEVLSLSVNEITTLKPFQNCHKLRELYLRSNKIEDIKELAYIQKLPALEILSLEENPLCKNLGSNYRSIVLNAMPQLMKLDNVEVTADELENAQRIALAGDSVVATSDASNDSIHGQQQHVKKLTKNQMTDRAQVKQLEKQSMQSPTLARKNFNVTKEKFKAPQAFNQSPKRYVQCERQAYHANNQRCHSYSPEFELYSAKNLQLHYDCLPHPYYENPPPHSLMPSQIECHYKDRISTTTSLHHQCTGYQCRPISRCGNVLSAILFLIKDLDYANLEVILNSVRSRLDDFAICMQR